MRVAYSDGLVYKVEINIRCQHGGTYGPVSVIGLGGWVLGMTGWQDEVEKYRCETFMSTECNYIFCRCDVSE